MQTFLPYPDFYASAKSLDRARLGKQRMEVITILKAMNGMTKKAGYANHPATQMWSGHQYQLCQYGMVVCDEWIGRGYKDTQRAIIESFISDRMPADMPWWLGIEEFHYAHQSNLIRKMPEYYESQFGYFVPNDLPYLWPTYANEHNKYWMIIDGKRRWKQEINYDMEGSAASWYSSERPDPAT